MRKFLKENWLSFLLIPCAIIIYVQFTKPPISDNTYDKYQQQIDSLDLEITNYKSEINSLKLKSDSLDVEIKSLKVKNDSLQNLKNKIKNDYNEIYNSLHNASSVELDSILRSVW